MLKKQNRFSKEDLLFFKKEKSKFSKSSEIFLVRVFENQNFSNKIGVILPKKFFGNRSAVKRNSIRRFVYSLFRAVVAREKERGVVKQSSETTIKQILFIFKSEKTKLNLDEIKKEIKEFMKSFVEII